MTKKFIVSEFIGDWAGLLSNEKDWASGTLDEKELKTLAEYYYINSDETEEIDFSKIENCISFVERVDVVREVRKEEQQ